MGCALAGRAERMEVSKSHYVLKTPMQGPWPANMKASSRVKIGLWPLGDFEEAFKRLLRDLKRPKRGLRDGQRLLLGLREGVLAAAGRWCLLHGGGLCGGAHAEPHLRGLDCLVEALNHGRNAAPGARGPLKRCRSLLDLPFFQYFPPFYSFFFIFHCFQ